ncbi:Zn-ribbon domain-containing OB-fold protein [Agrococcus baldri]|uniref:DNA-binding protein n=1 Tax=Agrococcus baldri TaxID=153730 RepID=A0AA87RMK3_9MICO|nr:Zn-ribbon domain-containing OB-fold protein [Agrococcus baldri]GEK81668.1 hypothetical protein ABA31_30190 [Agrococcus baldri]
MQTDTSPRFDLPTVEGDSEPWWSAIADGRLMVEVCNSCGSVHLYPRSMCPSCWSEDVELRESSGVGTLYAFSVVRMNDLPPFGERVPYVVGVVELAEGPRLMTNIVDVPVESVQIGMAVRFRARLLADGVSAPDFFPLSKEHAA